MAKCGGIRPRKPMWRCSNNAARLSSVRTKGSCPAATKALDDCGPWNKLLKAPSLSSRERRTQTKSAFRRRHSEADPLVGGARHRAEPARSPHSSRGKGHCPASAPGDYHLSVLLLFLCRLVRCVGCHPRVG